MIGQGSEGNTRVMFQDNIKSGDKSKPIHLPKIKASCQFFISAKA